MPDATAASGVARFLTFRIDADLYAVPAADVAEVIRAPSMARVPQAPASLLGVANLRGAVLPVASVRGLLGREPEASVADGERRAIVLNGEALVAVMVDAVDALVTVEAAQVQVEQAQVAAEPGELLRGAFQTSGDGRVAKILDLSALLAKAFVQRPRKVYAHGRARATDAAAANSAEDRRKLVTFEAAGQEFALPLEAVREIIPAPPEATIAPKTDAAVLGVVGYREGLLPLLSLRGLLGLPAASGTVAREKVVVAKVGGALVGLVTDRTRSIVPADPDLIEPTPSVIAARTGGEAQIAAIYRGEGGRRLISILSPDKLFREDIMQRLGQARAPEHEAIAGDGTGGTELRILVFRLGDDEFGLPIDAVDEVATAPEQITRVPKTPEFLEGVVNLRGEVLPVVDQRRRFDMPPLDDGARRRLVVVRTERHRAGLIVDSVSEVLRSTVEAVEPAPDLTGESTRLVSGVINLDGAGRIVLLLDPSELLSRAERGVLDRFQSDSGQENE